MDNLSTIYSNFFFLRPQLLWGFTFVVWFAIILFKKVKDQDGWKKNISPHLQQFMITKGNQSATAPKFILIGALSLIIVAAAGPTWSKIEKPGATIESALVVAFDASRSMQANDIKPNRLERGKQKVHDLLEAQPGNHVALIAFAQTAHLALPFTNDYTSFNFQLEAVDPSVMPVQGSNLIEALRVSDQVLQNIEAPSTILIVSDNVRAEDVEQIQQFVDTTTHHLEFMIMATPQGAAIPLGNKGRVYKDKNRKTVIPRMDTKAILKLNTIERVNVNTITLDNSDVEHIAKNLRSNLSYQKNDESDANDWEEYGYYLCFPLAFIILFWFRRGWKVQWAIVPLLLSLSACDTNQSNNKQQWTDLWYTRDQQGQILENKSLLDSALTVYENPMKRGYLLYQMERFEEANAEFIKIPTDTSYFNIGICMAEMGHWASSRDAFKEALSINPNYSEAQTNLNYIIEIIEKRKERFQELGLESKSQEESEELEELKELQDANFDEKKSDDEGEGKAPKGDQKGAPKQEEEMFQPIDPDAPITGEEAKGMVLRQMDNNPALFMKKKFQYQLYRDSTRIEVPSETW